MALINRVSRLFAADFNAVLDRIEEPAVLLKQSVREMEEAIDLTEQRIRRLDIEREQCLSRCAQAEATLSSIEEELDVCFSANEESLARTLVRRKLETERALDATRQSGERINAVLAELEAELDEHRGQLARVRQQAEVATSETSPLDPAVVHPVTADDVEVAFLREKQRRTA